MSASCYPETIRMSFLSHSSAFARVTALAAQRTVHSAFAWLHGNPGKIMDWQARLVGIPAPPFGEEARSQWLAARFAEAGLGQVHTDAAGNVFGLLPAANLPLESTGPVVVLSAHLDTVFPPGTPLNPVVDGLFYLAASHEGRTWPHYGRFVQIERPHKVEYTWVSEATKGVESVVSVTFEARGDETEVTLRHTGVPDDEMGHQHKDGWTWVLSMLAERFVSHPSASA